MHLEKVADITLKDKKRQNRENTDKVRVKLNAVTMISLTCGVNMMKGITTG